MINRKISVHLQDFPDISFLQDEEDLVKKMDMVRDICSIALAIRDQKNLRVRLPLNKLIIIGKNAAEVSDFFSIIKDEVNVKNIEIKEEIGSLAEIKLQINFKKIGAKFGSKIKEITQASKEGKWQKISENKIEIAGVELIDDDFEIKLIAKNESDQNLISLPLSNNECLIQLDTEITEDLENEGIARDIVRLIQQNRKEANFDISDYIKIQIDCKNERVLKVASKFAEYIKQQVLGDSLEIVDLSNKENDEKEYLFENSLDEGKLKICLIKI